jgi:hypothetical protein
MAAGIFHSGRLRRYGEIQIGPGDENRPAYNNQHFKRISATNRQHAPDVRYRCADMTTGDAEYPRVYEAQTGWLRIIRHVVPLSFACIEDGDEHNNGEEAVFEVQYKTTLENQSRPAMERSASHGR